jgi:hypothetical protein
LIKVSAAHGNSPRAEEARGEGAQGRAVPGHCNARDVQHWRAVQDKSANTYVIEVAC